MSDRSLIRNLNALLSPDQRKTLKAIEPRGALSGKRVSVAYMAPTAGAGGIASPLTEKTKTVGEAVVPDRDLYGESLLMSSDGLFVLSVASIKILRFLDAESRDVQFNLAAPVTGGA